MGGVILEILLCVQFALFSYSVLKIIRYMILLAGLLALAWIDYHEKKIPNKILKVLLLIRMVFLVPEWLLFKELGFSLFLASGMGLLVGGGLFLIVYFLSKGGVGMGDVKLMGVTGAYVGIGGIMPTVFLTVMISAVYSIVMLLLRKIKLKEEIPFAPFVLAGTAMAMAFGM